MSMQESFKNPDDVKAVRYLGLGHRFADMVRRYPQAEDCMIEIDKFMMDYLGE